MRYGEKSVTLSLRILLMLIIAYLGWIFRSSSKTIGCCSTVFDIGWRLLFFFIGVKSTFSVQM